MAAMYSPFSTMVRNLRAAVMPMETWSSWPPEVGTLSTLAGWASTLHSLSSEIGRRLSPELALLPIGAYNPPTFRNVHTNPADATHAFLDLKSRWMVPMHYGTFRLSHDDR